MRHSKAQRLFFALWPDAGVRGRLGGVMRGMPRHGGRLLHPEDLHLTLVFLGRVEPEKAGCIERAARAVSCPPFELVVDRVEYWRRPRILWCGPSSMPAELSGLVGDLTTHLKSCGFEAERRPYCPHITLARKGWMVEPFCLEKPIRWPVSDFVLACSDSGSEAVRYRVLKKWSMDS